MKWPTLTIVVAIMSLSSALVCIRAAETDLPRERVSLNAGWRFYKGDPQWMSPQLDYASVRAWLVPSSAPLLGIDTVKLARPSGNLGSDIACVQPGYDDSSWRTLNL